MQDTIEKFIARNHKTGTVTKFDTVGHKCCAFFSTEKVSITLFGQIQIDLNPWQIAFMDDELNVMVKNTSRDYLKPWRVKESGEFKRFTIDGGKISL